MGCVWGGVGSGVGLGLGWGGVWGGVGGVGWEWGGVGGFSCCGVLRSHYGLRSRIREAFLLTSPAYWGEFSDPFLGELSESGTDVPLNPLGEGFLG